MSHVSLSSIQAHTNNSFQQISLVRDSLMSQDNSGTSSEPNECRGGAATSNSTDPKAAEAALTAALHDAVRSGDIAAAKDLIIHKGAKEDSLDSQGRTPMIIAALNRDVAMVKMLGHGHDAFAYLADNSGTTPLMIAAKNNDIEMAKAFWPLGGRKGLQDNNGWTAMHFAAEQGSAEMLRALSMSPTKYALRNCDGSTPLDLAASGGHVEAVALILEICKKKLKKKDFSLQNTNLAGRTPLHSAVVAGSVEAVEFLYEAEPLALNIPDKNGDTPLNSAASRGDLKLTELLLSYGGDRDLPDNKGETPLTKASRGGFDDVANLVGRYQQTKANNPPYTSRSKSGNILGRIFRRS
ncbi:unnamed protein product [Clonostachys solani]|uniref:Uncharacterized protein n=1 Tax=Clonostachys solani TaxID=160281 RepID=A0A9N9W666_9HYPO|nr:unnamed protein product [Clonostachys solani]